MYKIKYIYIYFTKKLNSLQGKLFNITKFYRPLMTQSSRTSNLQVSQYLKSLHVHCIYIQRCKYSLRNVLINCHLVSQVSMLYYKILY